MKGIILAGGSGTRLYPMTKVISKQLLPVFNKPMIYYPLSTLMLAGIKEILIISTETDLPKFQKLFDDGATLGLNIVYKVQPFPEGLAQALIIGEKFIGNDDVCLILGDNIFYGHALPELLKDAARSMENNLGSIFAYHVNNRQSYGVIEFSEDKKIKSMHEKPKKTPSNFAVTGLYFYPNDAISMAKKIKPSDRGELEITELNNMFIQKKRLDAKLMGRGYAWFDTGTPESLLEATNFIEAIEMRQGLKIAALEEIAYEIGNISKSQLQSLALKLKNSSYGKYLLKRLESN